MLIKRTDVLFYALPLLFVILYFPIFYSDYAYSDEVYALWHNDDKTNYSATQGRLLSGLIFHFFYSSISRIAELKLLRLFSWFGWIITTIVWTYILKKWVKLLRLPGEIHSIGALYFVCSISVCVYIGWAACMQIFLGTCAGLASGHLLFAGLVNQKDEIHLSNRRMVSSLVLAMISLFIYQNSFGIFLIPFFLYYVQARKARPEKVVLLGVTFYLLMYVVYYFLFKYCLNFYHLEASDRAEIQFNLLKKLSFFFSGPFPQGFSMNLLFSASSIFSQIFYPVVFAVWVILVFKGNTHQAIRANVFFVAFILLLLALIYLPSMAAAENFPSYRTLFAFNLAVFIAVVESLLFAFQRQASRRIFTIAMGLWLLCTSFYAFNFQFINPLKREFGVLQSFIRSNYHPGINKVYFIRADKFLFTNAFHTRVYRDELGAPSTYRDWVPEPITKQLIFELTKSRNVAKDINVVQFENVQQFRQSSPVLDSNSIVLDMNELFKSSNY